MLLIHLKFESMPVGQEIVIGAKVDFDLAFNLVSQERFVEFHNEDGGCTGLTTEEFKKERINMKS